MGIGSGLLYDLHPSVRLGRGTKIWPFATVREGAIIGEDCVIGRYAYIGEHVIIGDNVHIQNGAQIFGPTSIHDEVFIGPGVIICNDDNPRIGADWSPNGAVVEENASIGASAVLLPGVIIGKGAMVGAGAVVTKDVPAHETWVGSPACDINSRAWRQPIVGYAGD